MAGQGIHVAWSPAQNAKKKKDPPIRFLLHGRNVKNRETFTGATLLLVTGGIETLLSTCAWNMAWIFSRCFWAQKHNHHW